jgi:tetratricopeptide (TPR) repeat protein
MTHRYRMTRMASLNGALLASALALLGSSALPAHALAQSAAASGADGGRLFVAAAGAGPASAAPAAGNFADLMRRAGQAAHDKDWDRADQLAAQALDAAPNGYYRIEAAQARARINMAAGRLPAARQALQVAIAQLQKDGPEEDLADAQALAARLALQDHDTAQGLALTDAALKSARAYPGDWLAQDDGNTLFYRLAGVKLPVQAAGFVRTTVHAASERGDVASVRFVPMEKTYGDTGLDVQMEYRPLASHTPAPSVADELRKRAQVFALVSTGMKAARASDPGDLVFHPQNASGTAGQLFDYSEDGHAIRRGLWLARRGPWVVSIDAHWPKQQDAAVRDHVKAFFAAVDWSGSPVETKVPEGVDADVSTLLQNAYRQQGWGDIAASRAQATQANDLAIFPAEHAAALSLLGLAAFHAGGQDDMARRYLTQAQAYWPWVALSGYQEDLFDDAQLGLAALSFQANDNTAGIEAMNRYTQGTTFDGQLDAATAVVKDKATGLGLPPRIDDFLRTFSDSRIYYVQPRTGLRVGVTLFVHSPAPDMNGAIAQMTQWMKQNRKATFDEHVVARLSFDPAGPAGAQGQFLRIPYTRSGDDDADTVTVNPGEAPSAGQRVMGFWIVRPAAGKNIGQIVLRAEWAQSDKAAESAAAKLAQGFPWP